MAHNGRIPAIIAALVAVIMTVTLVACANQAASPDAQAEETAAGATTDTTTKVADSSDTTAGADATAQEDTSAEAADAQNATTASTDTTADQASNAVITRLQQNYGDFDRSLLPDALAKQSELNQAASQLAGHDVSDAVAYGPGTSCNSAEAARNYVVRHIIGSPAYAKMFADLFSITPLANSTYIGANSWAVYNTRAKWANALSVAPDANDLSGLECFIWDDEASATGYRVSDDAFLDAAGIASLFDSFTYVETGSGYQNLLNFHNNPCDYVTHRVATVAGYQEDTSQVWLVFALINKNGDALLVDNGGIGDGDRKYGNGDGATVYLGVNVKDGRVGLLKKVVSRRTATTVRASSGRASGGYHGGGCTVVHRVTRVDNPTVIHMVTNNTVTNTTNVVTTVNNVEVNNTTVNNNTVVNNVNNTVNNTTVNNINNTNVVNNTNVTDIDITDIDITDIDITDIDINVTPPNPPTPPTPPTDEEKDPNLDPVNNGNTDTGGGQDQPGDGSGDLEATDPADDQSQGHQDPETTYPDTPAPDPEHQDTVIDNTNENPMNYEAVIDDSQTWTDPETGDSTTYTAPEDGQASTPGAVEHGEFDFDTSAQSYSEPEPTTTVVEAELVETTATGPTVTVVEAESVETTDAETTTTNVESGTIQQ